VNNCTNTADKSTFLARKRVTIGAASVLATSALLGMGAQAAFADTPNTTPSGAASASTSAGTIQAEVSAMLRGHVNGVQAQKLATSLANDDTAFSLLPSKLQSDVTTLKNASPTDRVADAKTIAKTALHGGYGSLIESIAKEIRSTHGDKAHSIVAEVVRDLKLGGSTDHQAARIANTVTEHKHLASSLPAALTGDLRTLADAPAADRGADLQKIEATALSGGYGAQAQKVATSIVGSMVSTH